MGEGREALVPEQLPSGLIGIGLPSTCHCHLGFNPSARLQMVSSVGISLVINHPCILTWERSS